MEKKMPPAMLDDDALDMVTGGTGETEEHVCRSCQKTFSRSELRHVSGVWICRPCYAKSRSNLRG